MEIIFLLAGLCFLAIGSYDPSRPADARIDRGRWNKAIPVLVFAFGMLFCSLGVWIYSRRLKEREIPCTTAG